MNDEMQCVVPFPDQSPSFTHGFEAGVIWQRMTMGELEIDGKGLPLHSDNVDLFRSMAGYYGYDMEVEPTEYPEWINVKFTKRRARLTVVERNEGREE